MKSQLYLLYCPIAKFSTAIIKIKVAQLTLSLAACHQTIRLFYCELLLWKLNSFSKITQNLN